MDDPMAHIRAEVLAQPEAERSEYALDLLAFYLNPVPAFFDGCAALGIGLPLADIRVIYALDCRRGKFVSLDGLLAARCLDRPCDEWAAPDRVVKTVAVIRKRMGQLRLPVTIKTWHGVGYSLEAPANFRFEAAATPAQAVAL